MAGDLDPVAVEALRFDRPVLWVQNAVQGPRHTLFRVVDRRAGPGLHLCQCEAVVIAHRGRDHRQGIAFVEFGVGGVAEDEAPGGVVDANAVGDALDRVVQQLGQPLPLLREDPALQPGIDALGDVPEFGHEEPGGLQGDLAHLHLDRKAAAVVAQGLGLDQAALDPGLADLTEVLRGVALPFPLCLGHDQGDQGLADHVVALSAEGPLGDRVELDDLAGLVGHDDGVQGGIEDRRPQDLGVLKPPLGLLLPSDRGHAADETGALAILAAELVADPSIAAVAIPEAVFQGCPAPVAQAEDRLAVARPVVGMDLRLGEAGIRQEGAGRVAGDRLDAVADEGDLETLLQTAGVENDRRAGDREVKDRGGDLSFLRAVVRKVSALGGFDHLHIGTSTSPRPGAAGQRVSREIGNREANSV